MERFVPGLGKATVGDVHRRAEPPRRHAHVFHSTRVDSLDRNRYRFPDRPKTRSNQVTHGDAIANVVVVGLAHQMDPANAANSKPLRIPL